MHQPELATVVGDTPLLGRFTAQLEPDLVEHAQPRCSDRMTECLQATVAVDRQAAVETERTVEHISPGLAGVGEPEVLHQYEFGRREAVVDFGDGDLVTR